MKHQIKLAALLAGSILLAPAAGFAAGGHGGGGVAGGTQQSGGSSAIAGGTQQSGSSPGVGMTGDDTTGMGNGNQQSGNPVSTPDERNQTSIGGAVVVPAQSRPRGVGTAPNGLPIGSPGSGKGSPENPW